MKKSLQLTSLTLRVSDLAQSTDFYSRRIGFVVAEQSNETVRLATASDAPPILTLINGDAVPAPRDAAGLFHAALLLPDRRALASWLTFAAAHGIEFEGFSDHGVSEAIYLSDPDGNGLEIYTDRPRSEWPFADGELAMTTRPLAIRKLLAEAAPTSEPLAGSTWGHLHLRVTDLARSEAFYRKQLALEVTQQTYPGARFLAADGYHHHLGLNTWGSPRVPQPHRAIGLAEATFARAGVSVDEQLVDPDRITIRVTPLVAPPLAAAAL